MELSGKTPCTGIVISSMLRDVSVDGTRQMVSRRSNGFIIKLKGKTEYFFGEKKWLLKEGEILFVKKGSSYYIREITPGYSYVINFDACSEPEEDMFRLPIPQSSRLPRLVKRCTDIGEKSVYTVLYPAFIPYLTRQTAIQTAIFPFGTDSFLSR